MHRTSFAIAAAFTLVSSARLASADEPQPLPAPVAPVQLAPAPVGPVVVVTPLSAPVPTIAPTRRRTGLFVAGLVVGGVGLISGLAGVAVLAQGPSADERAATTACLKGTESACFGAAVGSTQGGMIRFLVGLPMAVNGGVMLAVGTGMAIAGGVRLPVKTSPEIALGPGSATVRWSF